MTGFLIRRAASISACGKYRYRLTRYWGPGKMLPFVMLNPSTADADVDDPTIRRCMGFARRFEAGGIIVVNLFAYRATDPVELKRVADPIGPANFDALQEIAIVSGGTNSPVICAWGTSAGERGADVVAMMRREHAHLFCLGLTKGGHPRHPLYVRGDAPLLPFGGDPV